MKGLGTQQTILVVDDAEANRYLILRLLRSAGYDVFEARTAQELFEKIPVVRPDLIILDVDLPDDNGHSVCYKIKSSPQTEDISVLQISAKFRSGEDHLRGVESGADGYLTTPIDPPVLLATVRALLRIYFAEKQSKELFEKDLTERKQAEIALSLAKQEAEIARRHAEIEREKLVSLFMDAPAAISVLRGPDHQIELCNRQTQKLIGGRDPTGLLLKIAIPEFDTQGFLKILDQVYQTGVPFFGKEVSIYYIQPDGSHRELFFDVNFQVWRDIEERIVGILKVGTDVTEAVRARNELQKSESKFRELANAMPQIAWTADETGKTNFLNARWYEYIGQVPQSEIRFDLFSMIHPQEIQNTITLWNKSIELKKTFVIEFRLLNSFGEHRWFMARAIPTLNSFGVITAWYGTCTDIDEQKRTQIQLSEALRTRDEFLSIASHELKTPLTSLKLQAQMAKKNIQRNPTHALAPDRVERLVEQTCRQVQRLTHLVDEMLDIARINSGRLTLHRESFDLRQLIEDILDRMSSQLQHAECPVQFQVPPESYGHWDRFRLEQVIVSLLTNATKYGAGKPIELHANKLGNDSIQIAVRDKGMGIAPIDHHRIFQRFERAVSANEISGMGLGLYIAKQIVEMHGGTIEVKSKLGQGAEFTVTLPLNEKDQDSHQLQPMC